jgi:predicted nucleotidyltransferase
MQRTETVPVSGTTIRQMLVTGDVEEFTKFLPPSIQKNAAEIIDILAKKSLGIKCRCNNRN